MLLEEANLLLRQRAKTEWLRSGDHNTKFYHECANARRKSNTIYAITNAEGRLCLSEDDVQLAFVNYFVGLFTTENARNRVPCLQLITCRITDVIAQNLYLD